MARKVVIGCGNPLAGDDGIGLRVIEELTRRGLPPEVKAIPAGLPGLTILGFLRGAQQAIIVDAADARQEPGTIICCQEKDLAKLPFRSLSLHGIGLVEALALGRLVEPAAFPPRLTFVAIQIGEIKLGSQSLSPPVAAALPAAVEAVYQLLEGGPSA